MIVTNGYGRSATSLDLYQLSATGQIYNFQTYARRFFLLVLFSVFYVFFFTRIVITDVRPTNGSIQGGTIVTIEGQYFSNTSQSSLSVNVGDQPCTVISLNLMRIQCQTLPMKVVNRTHFHGKSIPDWNFLNCLHL